jgi:tetratricopeptide (TPR) repeat protein
MRHTTALIKRTLTGCLLVPVLAIASESTAANRVRSLRLLVEDNHVSFALMLDERPRYSLASSDWRRLRLALFGAVKTPELKQSIEAYAQHLSLGENATPGRIHFDLGLNGRLQEVRSFWRSQEKVLQLEIGLSDQRPAGSVAAKRINQLKKLRLGALDSGARMVVDLEQRPEWELGILADESASLRLGASARNLGRKVYGPLRSIKEVRVKQVQDQVRLHIGCESRLTHLRVTWLEACKRFVVDLQDERAKISPGALPPLPQACAPVQNRADTPPGDASKSLTKTAPLWASSEEELGYYVKKKIPERPGFSMAASNGSGGTTRFEQEVSLVVKPELDACLPSRFLLETPVETLRPEEALAFGRVVEAFELCDWEKGVLLSEQFLRQFADSPLGEKLAFLSGDLQFRLLQSGRPEAFPKLTENYRRAIARYGKSPEVPWAFIKMAQATSLNGDDTAALGYLNLVFAKYKGDDHLPRAYMERGKIHLRLNHIEKAIDDFQNILDRYPDSGFKEEANFWIANYLHSVGNYQAAEKRLGQIAASEPDFYLEHPDFLFMRARNYFYLKDYARARDTYFEALNIGRQPESHDLLLCHIGDTYHHQALEKEAEKLYRTAVDYYPESEGAAIAKLRLANYTSGVTIYKEVHQGNINKPIGDLALLAMAQNLYRGKQFLSALDTSEKLIGKTASTDIQREAKKLFQRAFENETKRLFRARDYNALSSLYQSKGAGSVAEIDPEALLLVAQAFSSVERHHESIPVFLQIRPYDLSLPSRGRYFLGLAESYIKEGHPAKAATLLEKSEEQELIASDRQRMKMVLADVYQEKGKWKKARRLYEVVVKDKRVLEDREIAAAYYAIGAISNKEKNRERAKEALNRCIALVEKDKNAEALLQDAFVELGHTYHEDGRHLQAITSYQKGLDLGYGPARKRYWDTKFRLALSYLEIGEEAKAEPLLGQILDEGDPILQQRVELKLGLIGLEKQLKRLSIWQDTGE